MIALQEEPHSAMNLLTLFLITTSAVVVASKRYRVVYLEKSGLSAFEASKWFGIYHYALKVGKHGSYDWYEVAGNKTKQMKIKVA